MRLFGLKISKTTKEASSSRYVAPVPPDSGPQANDGSPAGGVSILVERDGSDEDDLMIIDHPNKEQTSANSSRRLLSEDAENEKAAAAKLPVLEALNTDFSGSSFGESGVSSLQTGPSSSTVRKAHTNTDDSAYIKVSNPNSLINGQLMHWKMAAQEGPQVLRFIAVLGAMGLIGSCIYLMSMFPEEWDYGSLVVATYVVMMSLTILVLDGRCCRFGRDPLSCRASMRDSVTQQVNVLRKVWGRGVFYILAGGLNCTLPFMETMAAGAVMMGIGLLAVCIGGHASRNLSTLQTSIRDETFLYMEFNKYEMGEHRQVNPSAFAHLLWDLGLELDDVHCLRAFSAIDTDRDGMISFEEFHDWWVHRRPSGGSVFTGITRKTHGTRASAAGKSIVADIV